METTIPLSDRDKKALQDELILSDKRCLNVLVRRQPFSNECKTHVHIKNGCFRVERKDEEQDERQEELCKRIMTKATETAGKGKNAIGSTKEVELAVMRIIYHEESPAALSNCKTYREESESTGI